MPELSAVAPTGTMSLIHLRQPGFLPPTATSKTPKHRPNADRRTMCALYIHPVAEVVPLVEALGWPGRRIGPLLPQWRWCGVCVGRALAAADQIGEAVRMLAEEATART